MFLRNFVTPQLPPAFRYRLDDGTPALVRPIRPEDSERIREGYKRLSALARRWRFADAAADELSDEQLKDITAVDHVNYSAWGAVNMNQPDEPGIGIARYIRVNGDPHIADVAITISDSYQSRGAGMVLHACLHLTAYRHGIHHLRYDVASENERFSGQLRSLGAEFTGRASNIERYLLPVYHRARDVPARDANGRRFADVFRLLQKVPAIDA
jgi:RimJ/RimL family protein N-acetyltransferase